METKAEPVTTAIRQIMFCYVPAEEKDEYTASIFTGIVPFSYKQKLVPEG